jgi:tetratricopeptide (TPR) repeat protein
MGAMARLHALVLALVLVALEGGARADLASARQKLTRGDYKGAAGELARLDSDEARVVLAGLRRRTGDYAGSEKLARRAAAAKDPATAIAARIELAETLRLVGRAAAARAELETALATAPDDLGLRHALGLVAFGQGDLVAARAAFGAIAEAYDKGKIGEKDATKLFYMAEASRYLAKLDDKDALYQDASDFYQEAVDRAPDLHEANIAWGRLFLEKFAPGPAQQSFDEVLKLDPNNPDAHAGLAAVNLETAYDLADASGHLSKALTHNPRHLPSLVVRAGLEIDRNEWDQAKKTIAAILAIDPNHLEGHSLAATIAWLRDDAAGYAAEEKKVLAANPRYAALYHIVARSAVREHRYKEAIELERKAVALDPTYYEAMEAIGSGLFRLGDEKQGLEWLKKAWRGDEFNVRTKNTLDLFEDVVAKQYGFASSKSFKIRYHNDERPIYRRYVEPLLEDALADMVARYGFTPKLPIVVELFQSAEHYSVRTIGLPNLGALGVCFGQVITAMSPSVGDINWAMVLWHELSHVFAIQLSRSRVPRWFTEGLSEYETVRARPEWRRENDADVWASLADGTLPSVAELNYGFMNPSMDQVMVAYHLSSITIQYVAETYGFPKIVEALELYGRGLETPAVIEEITGRTVAAFDAEFRAYLTARLAPYAGSFHLPVAALRDARKVAAAAAAAPRDAVAQGRLALARFYEGDAAGAGKAATAALALDGDQPLGLYVAAELAAREGQLEPARRHYERLIAVGGDSFDARVRLATIAQKQGDLPLAIAHLCTAKRLDPERSYPYQALAEIYKGRGDLAAALAELETYAMIEQMQLDPIRELVDGYAGLGTWAKVRRFGELALDINPADAELLLKLGRAYLETGAPDRALYSYDSALLVTPAMRRPALAHVGRARALAAQGDKAGARKAIQQALALEPDNKDALELAAP